MQRRIGWKIPLGLGVLAALIFGASGGVAYATASSSLAQWHYDQDVCYVHQATTRNTSVPFKAALGVNNSRVSSTFLCSEGNESREIGIAVFLKKTNGVACRTNPSYYANAKSLSRNVSYLSSSCGGAGTQLRATVTSYGWNEPGTGYVSGSISAPFQTF